MSIADNVSEIVRGAREAPEDDRTHEVLKGIRALPNIEELGGPLTFRSANFEIQVGLTAHLEKTAKKLEELKGLKLSVAPEVVSHQPYSDNESVLVTRYAAAEGERLVPVKPGQTGFSDAAKERVRKDLASLGDRGLVHSYASRGFAHWLASSDKKTLVLDGWSSLQDARPEDREENLQRIDSLLSRLA